MADTPLTSPQSPATPRWRHYWSLMRADRPIGTLLLLWPTWWALWLAAGGLPPLWTLFVFTAGVWLTRSAGCVINDYADRHIDGHVTRTRARPLADGRVTEREALVLFAVLVVLGLLLHGRLGAWQAAAGGAVPAGLLRFVVAYAALMLVVLLAIFALMGAKPA